MNPSKRKNIEIEGLDAENEGLDAENEGLDNGDGVNVNSNALHPDQKGYRLRNTTKINYNDERPN